MARSIHTDLALEAREFFKQQSIKEMQAQHQEPPGVEVENAGNEDIKITRVRVTSPTGEQSIGKPMGNYITLEIPNLKYSDQKLFEDTCKELAKELKSMVNMLNLSEKGVVLIVGLGNWNVTPDALGPKVTSSVMVTRHLHQFLPDQVEEGVRSVCAVAPGVLGITGIETGETIRGIVDRVKPEFVIAIDALASRKLERVCTTVQMADTGISPGSGVGNKRMSLSKETLGVPVIAIGVPTVVDAPTMANDVIDMVLDSMVQQAGEGSQFYTILKEMDREEKYQLIKEVMSPYAANLIVTPKEVDEVIEKMSKIIANSLNMSLHQSITLDDVNRYLH